MFTGFTPETIDFLWNIRFNNNKTWFEAHKKEYLDTLYRPMRALGEELFDPFRAVPSMRCAVSRIYRDNRIPQPVPYKDHLMISIRKPIDSAFMGEAPVLFFELRPESFGYGLVFWGPKAAVMEEYRKRIALQPARFCELVENAERATGFRLEGERYKRQKSCDDPALARFFNLKNFYFYQSFSIDESLYSPELAGTVRGTLLPLLPLFEFLQDVTESVYNT